MYLTLVAVRLPLFPEKSSLERVGDQNRHIARERVL